VIREPPSPSPGAPISPAQSRAPGRLSAPTLDVHASFLQALDEYHDEALHLDLSSEELADAGRFMAWAERLHHAGINGEADCERDRVPRRLPYSLRSVRSLLWASSARKAEPDAGCVSGAAGTELQCGIGLCGWSTS
jgi:hypothetical protein